MACTTRTSSKRAGHLRRLDFLGLSNLLLVRSMLLFQARCLLLKLVNFDLLASARFSSVLAIPATSGEQMYDEWVHAKSHGVTQNFNEKMG